VDLKKEIDEKMMRPTKDLPAFSFLLRRSLAGDFGSPFGHCGDGRTASLAS
jgi:hypothetical protein